MEQNKRMPMWLMWACKKPGTYKTESLLWDSIANHYNHDLLFSPRFVFSRENVKFNKKGLELRTCDIAQTSEFRLFSLWTNSFGLTIETKRIWSRENELRERKSLCPKIIFLNLFKVRARAAKVIFVCCFRDSRGLLSRERDMFRCFAAKHLKFDSH